jgi:hypothetical protein
MGLMGIRQGQTLFSGYIPEKVDKEKCIPKAGVFEMDIDHDGIVDFMRWDIGDL